MDEECSDQETERTGQANHPCRGLSDLGRLQSKNKGLSISNFFLPFGTYFNSYVDRTSKTNVRPSSRCWRRQTLQPRKWFVTTKLTERSFHLRYLQQRFKDLCFFSRLFLKLRINRVDPISILLISTITGAMGCGS